MRACVRTHTRIHTHSYTHLSASVRADLVWYLGATLLRITGRPVSTVGIARSIKGNAASNGSHAGAALGVRRVCVDRVGPLALGDVAEISCMVYDCCRSDCFTTFFTSVDSPLY